MTSQTSTPRPVRNRPLGLPVIALVGLAALAAPRVILHDLGIVTEDDPLTLLLVFLPIAVWIAVAVATRVPNPFLTLLVVGLFSGAFLAIGHQVLWLEAFDGVPPSIGDGPAGEIVPRIAAFPSSVFTGTIVGAISGLIAWGIRRVLDRRVAAR